MVWMGLVRWWLHEKPLTGASFIRCGDFLISYRVYTCKAHVHVSSRPDSIVTLTKTTHALSVPRHWELDFIRRGCSSLYMIRTGTKFSPPYSNRVDLARVQTCQLSRFCRESHDFLSFLTVSRQGSSISQVLGKIILKWFKLLNQNKNGKLTRNACAIKWKTNKEEHCSYFFVPSCDFRLCSINLIVFLRVCLPFWKGSRPWERGLIHRRLPCWVSQ